MIGLRFLIQVALVPFMGGYMRLLAAVRNLPRGGRIAIYTAAGLITLTVEMILLTLGGIRWSAVLIALPPLVATAIVHRSSPAIPTVHGSRRGPAILIAALALLIFAAAVGSARVTSFDLLRFWGPKGQRFGFERRMDWSFLADPDHMLMHPDYPPLVPLLFAWTMLGGQHLDWFGAIATAPLFLVLLSAIAFAFMRHANVNSSIATVPASMFALLLMMSSDAGNAEPALLFFETLALAGIVCWRERPGEHAPIVAIALVGAVLTKVEGLAFVMALALTHIRSIGKVVLVPLVAAATWLALCAHYGLLDTYRLGGNTSQVVPSLIALVHEASFSIAFAPWLVVLVLILCGRPRAAFPLIGAAALMIAFLVFAYSRGGSPQISWSAMRVLMTPLLMLFFAAVAALRDSPITSTARRAAAP